MTEDVAILTTEQQLLLYLRRDLEESAVHMICTIHKKYFLYFYERNQRFCANPYEALALTFQSQKSQLKKIFEKATSFGPETLYLLQKKSF